MGDKIPLLIGLLLFAACGPVAAPDGGLPPTPSPAYCGAPDGGDAGPTDLPFDLVPIFLPDGGGGTIPIGVRFALQFGIGDAGTIGAYLDTGSYGIQLIQSAVSPAVIASLSGIGTAPVTEEFEGGIEATGVIALAPVTFGNLTTPAPIEILLIQKLS